MDIELCLLEKRVPPALFRKFSSRSDNWLSILARYERELSQSDGKLILTYNPAKNEVIPVIHSDDREITLLLMAAASGFEPAVPAPPGPVQNEQIEAGCQHVSDV